jgi:hypothetical protein
LGEILTNNKDKLNSILDIDPQETTEEEQDKNIPTEEDGSKLSTAGLSKYKKKMF